MFSQHRLGVRSRPCNDNGDFPAAGAATVGYPSGLAPAQGTGSVVLSYVAEGTFICHVVSHVNRKVTLINEFRGQTRRGLSVEPSSKTALEYSSPEWSIRERAS